MLGSPSEHADRLRADASFMLLVAISRGATWLTAANSRMEDRAELLQLAYEAIDLRPRLQGDSLQRSEDERLARLGKLEERFRTVMERNGISLEDTPSTDMEQRVADVLRVRDGLLRDMNERRGQLEISIEEARKRAMEGMRVGRSDEYINAAIREYHTLMGQSLDLGRRITMVSFLGTTIDS